MDVWARPLLLQHSESTKNPSKAFLIESDEQQTKNQFPFVCLCLSAAAKPFGILKQISNDINGGKLKALFSHHHYGLKYLSIPSSFIYLFIPVEIRRLLFVSAGCQHSSSVTTLRFSGPSKSRCVAHRQPGT